MNDLQRDPAHQQRGYNLVEVLIAMAVLGMVLLSIISLFVLGRKNVYSGKQMTRAAAIMTRVVEDLSVMPEAQVFTNFGLTNATALTPSVTLFGQAYTK